MKTSILSGLIVAALCAAAADTVTSSVESAIRISGKAFLGTPVLKTHKLFEGRGTGDIITTRAGKVPEIHNNQPRESTNGGATWNPPREISPDVGGCAIVHEGNDEVLPVHADKGFLCPTRTASSWFAIPSELTGTASSMRTVQPGPSRP